MAPAQIGAGIDHQRDAARNLLRPQAEVVAVSAKWRSADPGDRAPHPHTDGAVERRPTVPWIAGSNVGSDTCLDREPHGFAVRAGFSRAPPMVIGRTRTFA